MRNIIIAVVALSVLMGATLDTVDMGKLATMMSQTGYGWYMPGETMLVGSANVSGTSSFSGTSTFNADVSITGAANRLLYFSSIPATGNIGIQLGDPNNQLIASNGNAVALHGYHGVNIYNTSGTVQPALSVVGNSSSGSVASFISNSAVRFFIGQNGAIGIGTGSPATSTVLDVVSTTGGIRFPRMTSAQRIAITSPATGLMIDQTDGVLGVWRYNGTSWVSMVGNYLSVSVSGNGSTTTFSTPHGLGYTPTYLSYTAGSTDADQRTFRYITADPTSIIVNYATAPVTGTNNVTFYVQAR